MKRKRSLRSSGAVLLVAVLALILSVAPALADGVPYASPTDTVYGQTLGQWGGQWWIWALGIPKSDNPLYDTTGADCGVSQSGPVWFLAGTLTYTTIGSNVVSTADRNCKIPSGKAILFPVLNTECSTVEGNGVTFKQLDRCATGIMSGVSQVEADWDGVTIAANPLPSSFLVESPLMTFTLPQDNVLADCGPHHTDQCPAGSSNFVSDGYYVMLTSPSLGHHTLHFHGEVPFASGGSFILDVTYHLVIAG